MQYESAVIKSKYNVILPGSSATLRLFGPRHASRGRDVGSARIYISTMLSAVGGVSCWSNMCRPGCMDTCFHSTLFRHHLVDLAEWTQREGHLAAFDLQTITSTYSFSIFLSVPAAPSTASLCTPGTLPRPGGVISLSQSSFASITPKQPCDDESFELTHLYSILGSHATPLNSYIPTLHGIHNHCSPQ